MEKSRLIDLIRKKDNGEISLLELKELNDAIEREPLYASVLDSLKELSDTPPLFNKRPAIVLTEELDQLKNRINYQSPGARRLPIKRWLSVAAVLVVAVTGTWSVLVNRQSKDSSPINVIATEKGSKTTITLMDGTRVWVNADTKLTYDNKFGVKTRSVWLSGEAYFEVAKDKDHPFIVHTQLMDITALGTAFNVRSYKGELHAQAALMEGSVEVAFRKKEAGKILLKPMEKVIVKDPVVEANVEKELPEIAVLKISYDSVKKEAPETDWLKNRLVFSQERLETIVKTLERQYGHTIHVRDSALLNRKLSGIFQDESLAEILETFRLAAGIRYKIDKNNVLLYK